MSALLAPRRTLVQDAVGVLLATVYLVVASKLAVVGVTAGLPHLQPAGHAWFLFGESAQVLAARHHGGYHAAHQAFLGLVFGEARAPALVGLLYTSATIVVLSMWAPRRFGPAGWLAPLLYATTPFVVLFGPIPSHEAAAIFWLLVTWWLLERLSPGDVDEPAPWPGWVALAIASSMAALSDHGGWIGVLCLAVVASWPADLRRRSTLVTPALVAGAAVVGALAALPRDADIVLYTMDTRFFDGFDHLMRLGLALPAMLAWPALGVLAVWPLVAVLAALRQRPLPGSPLLGTLYLVAALEMALLREPGWSSNLAWPAVTAALATASLAAALSMRLARSRLGGSRVVQPALVATLMVATTAPTALQARATYEASPGELLHFVQGMRTAQFEGVTRWLVSVADSMVDADEVIYLGPGTLCSLECLAMGAPKRFLTKAALIEGGMPDDGVLVIRDSRASDIEALDGVPGFEVSGYRLLDARRRLSRTLHEVQLRRPLVRIVPRALARPPASALTEEREDHALPVAPPP